MSRYNKDLASGRLLSYGLDKPTGGYFFQEFLTDEEFEETGGDSDIVTERDGLSLTSLITDLMNGYAYVPPIDMLVSDFFSEENPTPLQFHVGQMFDKDIKSMLLEVMNDVVSWSQRN